MDTLITHAPVVAMYIGFTYLGLFAARPLLKIIVGLTKTNRDDVAFSYLFGFLDKYSLSFKSLAKFASEYRKGK